MASIECLLAVKRKYYQQHAGVLIDKIFDQCRSFNSRLGYKCELQKANNSFCFSPSLIGVLRLDCPLLDLEDSKW